MPLIQEAHVGTSLVTVNTDVKTDEKVQTLGHYGAQRTQGKLKKAFPGAGGCLSG